MVNLEPDDCIIRKIQIILTKYTEIKTNLFKDNKV